LNSHTDTADQLQYTAAKEVADDDDMTACNIAVMLCCVHVDSDDSAVTRLLKLLMSLFSG